MCKFTMLIKSSSTENFKELEVDINTKLDATERPSYIEYYPENKLKLIFHYTGSTEYYKEKQYNSLFLKYGETSGRIKQIEFTGGIVNETDEYTLINDLIVDKSLRFINNIKNGVSMAIHIFQNKSSLNIKHI